MDSLQRSGMLTAAVLVAAADLLGDTHRDGTNPEYVRGVTQLARDLIGYTGDGDVAIEELLKEVDEVQKLVGAE